MTFTIVPRATIGVPDPAVVGRSRLARPLPRVLVHYTGASGYSDPAQDLAYAKKVAAYGVSAGKSWEYNYLIGLGGTVFEQAGDYLGAHCANFNSKSIGVLMMLGVNVPPTTAMVNSFRQLHGWLVDTGRVTTNLEIAPHYRYRTTACPGLTLAEAPGASWASPTGEGRLGNVIPQLEAVWDGQAAPTVSVMVPAPTVRLGSTGQNVKDLQNVMKFWGWYTSAVDGIAGSITVQGIKKLQTTVKVTADGVYGSVTANAYKVWATAMATA